jgi:hypothetical protein
VGRTLAGGATEPRLAFACALASAGTFIVYSVDRLRDRDRDAKTSPARTAFVSRNRGVLLALIVVAAVICLGVIQELPRATWGLCGAVLTMGLLHRRLKSHPPRTLAYVSMSWVAVVVGLPALIVGPRLEPSMLLVTAVGIGLAVSANAMASALRGLRFDANAAVRLRTARFVALASLAICLVVPTTRPMALIGAATWISVLLFRPDERYGLVVLDGALMVGAIAASLATRLVSS